MRTEETTNRAANHPCGVLGSTPRLPAKLRTIALLAALSCLCALPARSMTIVKTLTDSFSRGNNSNLGTTDDIQAVPWVKGANNGGGTASSPGITNSSLTFHSSTDATSGTSSSDVGMGAMQAYFDQYTVKNLRLSVKITATGTVGPDDKWMGVRWRQAAAGGGGGDGFSFFVRPNGSWSLQADGVDIATGTTTPWTVGVPNTILITATNNSHTIKYNSVVLTNVTSAVKPDAGYISLVTYHGDTVSGVESFDRTYDDFSLANDDIYRVEDYSGGPNWGFAIRSAVADAIAAGPGKTVLFETNGTYNIAASDPNYPGIFVGVANANSLVIHGNPGTTLIGGIATNGMFKFQDCTNFTLRGITIDYNPLPFTQGLIIGKNETNGIFDVQIDSGFPKVDAGYFPDSVSGLFMDQDMTKRLMKANTSPMLNQWSKISSSVFRFTTSGQNLNNIVPNQDRYVCTARANGMTCVSMNHCTNSTLSGVTVNASPELTFVALSCSGMTFTNCQIRFAGTRLIASNADGIHCGGGQVGPLIIDCYFEGLMDDCVNIRGILQTLKSEIQDDLEVTLDRTDVPVNPGDRLQIVDYLSGQVRLGTVASAFTNNNRWHVTFTTNVAGIAVDNLVFNLNYSLEGYQVLDNVFRNSRNYGARIRSGYGVIDGNCVTNMGLAMLLVQNDITSTFVEGPVPYSITISNNVADTVGRAFGAKGEGAIQITTQKTNALATTGYGVSNIRVTGNYIRNWPVIGAYVGAATNVVFTNNTFTCGTLYPIYSAGTRGIVFERTSNNKLQSNILTDQRDDGTTGWLQYGVHLKSTANGTTVTNMTYTLPNYTKNLQDD